MTHFKTLSPTFYDRATPVIARELLGHWLIHQTTEGICGGVIVETEAYLGDDPASHSFRGPTRRNAAMFGPPGHAYVYFIYGNHFCVNAVCGPQGVGEAVLIRAIQPTFGAEIMRAKRQLVNDRQVSNGPGKLCAALGINRMLDGADLCDLKSALFIAENPDAKNLIATEGPIKVALRIGITKAAEAPWRFYLGKSRFVSRIERQK